jgi:hypothetical protein
VRTTAAMGLCLPGAHWPYLVNRVESKVIPVTNNAVEMVVRRFDQHYQNFCGFESIQTARLYLSVFEKVYRFTPFSKDARSEIRGNPDVLAVPGIQPGVASHYGVRRCPQLVTVSRACCLFGALCGIISAKRRTFEL